MTFCVLHTWCGCAALQQTSPWGRSLSLSGNISCAARQGCLLWGFDGLSSASVCLLLCSASRVRLE